MVSVESKPRFSTILSWRGNDNRPSGKIIVVFSRNFDNLVAIDSDARRMVVLVLRLFVLVSRCSN